MANKYPHLCGGTFFTLVLQALKQRTSARQRSAGVHDNLSETDVLIGLIRVIYPEFLEPPKSTFKTNTSDYKKCKISSGTYLPFGEPATILAFDERVKRDYQSAFTSMCGFVDTFIEVGTVIGKDVRLVKALIELIAADKSIGVQDQFYSCKVGQVLTKAELVVIQEVCLPAFLLGIWHYILTNRKENYLGVNTFNRWHAPTTELRAKRNFIGLNGASVTRNIKITLGDKPKEIIALENEHLTEAESENQSPYKPEILPDNTHTDKQKSSVYFDEKFDGRVLNLDRALRHLSETLDIDDKNQSDIVVIKFVEALNEIVSQSEWLIDPVRELKLFVENITKLSKEWAVAAKATETDIAEIVRPLSVVLTDIKSALHIYLDFRIKYLLTTKFSLPQNATPSEVMLATFKQTVFDYHIYQFANTNPLATLSFDLEIDVEYFVEVINDKILLSFAYAQKEPLFLRISEFVKAIEYYTYYLSNHMCPMNDRRVYTFGPSQYDDNINWTVAFQQKTLNFCKELNRIFGEITNGETLFIYDVSEGGSSFDDEAL